MGFFDEFVDIFIYDPNTNPKACRRRDTREYIKRAKELVNEGNDIYNRAYNRTIEYARETERRLKEHLNYKQSIAKELGNDISGTLKNFKLDIKYKSSNNSNINISWLNNTYYKPVSNSSSLNMFNSSVSLLEICSDNIPSIFDFFSSDDDYYEAKRQRDEAKRYKEEMKMEREKFTAYREKMSQIRDFIYSEEEQINSLMDKLRKMTNEIKKSSNKQKLTRQESEYLKCICKICEKLSKLLTSEFLDDNFSINEKYKNILKGIKRINENLPSEPSISDGNLIPFIDDIF